MAPRNVVEADALERALHSAKLLTTAKPMNANKMDDLKKIVKMLAVMESNPEQTDPVMEFLVTGRTGRRNAMADILGPHATVTSGDLPERLQSLTTTDKEAGPSTSLPVQVKVQECPDEKKEDVAKKTTDGMMAKEESPPRGEEMKEGVKDICRPPPK